MCLDHINALSKYVRLVAVRICFFVCTKREDIYVSIKKTFHVMCHLLKIYDWY